VLLLICSLIGTRVTLSAAQLFRSVATIT
jgi:hypothetical protein